MIFPDGAAERPAKIVLFFVSLGGLARVRQHASGVEHGILVVFKERAVKLIRAGLINEIGDAAAGLAVFC